MASEFFSPRSKKGKMRMEKLYIVKEEKRKKRKNSVKKKKKQMMINIQCKVCLKSRGVAGIAFAYTAELSNKNHSLICVSVL